ncbi:hypothetical protein AMECASPLE_007763 [Ameca splendens]|uniref:Uncharacterized protein n=1 Tax=Ameca splendens TaxID=208324 RepID=A0ABV0YB70_9TELE
MPDVFACPPFPSLWFLQGHTVSIRASGLQEPEHSSVSVLPREAQPCLGSCICGLGASCGERANPGASSSWFHSGNKASLGCSKSTDVLRNSQRPFRSWMTREPRALERPNDRVKVQTTETEAEEEEHKGIKIMRAD